MENQESDGEAGSDASSSSSSVNSELSLQDYAVYFTNLVMKTFKNQPDTRREYVRLMKNFKKHRISSDRLVFGVHLLFKEHKELLKGFNDKFVPKKYKDRAYLRGFHYEDAFVFVDKVKRRFSQEPNMWSIFLLIIFGLAAGAYDRADGFLEMSKLFEGAHRDLLMEYWTYLPPII